jgi:hypothetical protein
LQEDVRVIFQYQIPYHANQVRCDVSISSDTDSDIVFEAGLTPSLAIYAHPIKDGTRSDGEERVYKSANEKRSLIAQVCSSIWGLSN